MERSLSEILIAEAEYPTRMYEEVLPALAAIRKDKSFVRVPGEEIFFEQYDAVNARGVLVLLHGYSESIPKHYESVYTLWRMGYTVLLLQLRGHGYSYREVEDLSMIHVTDEEDFIRDIHYLRREVASSDKELQAYASLPWLIYGHSMGGALAALTIAEYPDDFAKAVLSCPMMEWTVKGLSVEKERALTAAALREGREKTYADGQGPYRGEWSFEKSNAGTKARFDYYFEHVVKTDPHYRCWGSSWGMTRTLRAIMDRVLDPALCAKIKTPLLLLYGEKDPLVGHDGQKQFMKQISNGQMIMIPDEGHELYSSKDAGLLLYWEKIFEFLEE